MILKSVRPLLGWINVLVVCLWLACLNASAIFEFDQFPSLALITDRGWQLALINICVTVLVFVLIIQNKLRTKLLIAWTKNKWLFVFLAISVASTIWSVYLSATIYELILLVSSTVGASFFAIRFRLNGMLNVLTGFAIFCTIASLLIVFFTPYGIMQGSGHADSWRGLFWHRNHTGSLMAFFNMVFLVRLINDKNLPRLWTIVFGVFYLLTVVHIFESRSATGIIIFVILNFLGILSYIWMKLRAKIRVWQYAIFSILFIAVLFLVLSNLDFVFGLLNRSTMMTGRTMMWPDLFFNDYLKKPVIGHGFGAIWMQEGYRATIQARWGWSYQPYFSDNGYLDLLLNLGFVGLAVFLVGIGIAFTRNIKLAKENGSWLYIFSLLTLVYIVLANLTYSFLFEVDYFVWSLLVIVSFVLSDIENG